MNWAIFYSLSLIVIANFIIGVVILSRGFTRVNWIFGLMTISSSTWSVGILGFHFYTLNNIDYSWVIIAHASAAFIAISFLYFSFSFPNQIVESRIIQILPILPFLLIIYLLINSEFIIGEPVGNIYPLNEGYTFYTLYISLYFLLGYIGLWFQRKKTKDEKERLQIYYVLIGAILTSFFGSLTNLIFPFLGIYDYTWLGPIFTSALVASIAYAVLKHNLFDIKVVSTEILIFILWIFLLIRTLVADSLRDRFIDGGLLFAVIFLGIILIRSVLNEVKAREEISRLAEELKGANLELKKLDQLKSEFVSLASHQLRTPLTVIKGYISLIQEGSYGAVSDQLKDALRKIYISNETLINLVGDFLNLSRIESGRMKYLFEPVDASEIVASIYEEFKEVVKEKKLDLTYEKSSKPLPKAMIDKDKFRQVVMNLVDNAIKYTQKGFVKLKIEEDNSQYSGPSVLISVSDSGIGMSEEDRSTIFKRFTRGEQGWKVNTGGLGLGLYLAKRIVTDHGGEIWAESKGVGQGSTFLVRLPARAAQQAKENEMKEFVSKI